MGDIDLDEGRRAQASFSAVATPNVIFDRRAGDDRDRFMSVDEYEVDLRLQRGAATMSSLGPIAALLSAMIDGRVYRSLYACAAPPSSV
jgi:hypothetical protein